MWANLLDDFDITCEVDMFRKTDEEMLEILLGRRWLILNESDQTRFIMKSANELMKFVIA